MTFSAARVGRRDRGLRGMVLKSWKANDVVASWAIASVIVTLIRVAAFAHRFRDLPWVDTDQP